MRASRSEDMPAVSGFDNVTVAAESGTVRARATASGRSCISDSLRSGAYHLQGRSQTITAEHAEFAEVFLGHETTKTRNHHHGASADGPASRGEGPSEARRSESLDNRPERPGDGPPLTSGWTDDQSSFCLPA